MDAIAVHLGRDGIDIFAGRCGKILQRVEAAQFVEIADNVFGNPARVESVASLGGDRFHGLGEQRLRVFGTQVGRMSANQQDVLGVGVAGKAFLGIDPGFMDDRGNGVTLSSVMDRRAQHLADLHVAVVLDQAAPGINGARHRDRMGAFGLERRDAVFQEPFGFGGTRCPARAVIGYDVGRALGCVEAEDIASHTGRHRLDHGQRRGGGNRGIHGIAACAQNVDGGHRRGRMRRAGHAVFGIGGGTGRGIAVAHRSGSRHET